MFSLYSFYLLLKWLYGTNYMTNVLQITWHWHSHREAQQKHNKGIEIIYRENILICTFFSL